MKMKKNDLLEVIKLGTSAVEQKIQALQEELIQDSLKLKRGELKNLRTNRLSRRAIAQLKTATVSIKGAN